ncbi:MAG: Ku protein [Pseudolabrys sp.]
MAPRAYWKGYLRLSLVSCPIQLFPAATEREKVRFHQINRETGNRIRYRKVDAESGDEVAAEDIVKGYEASKGSYIEIQPEELEAVEIESNRMIDIDQFVPKNEIDELYLANPYYIVPDGDVGAQAFAVIREAIRKEGMVALGKVVFTNREHVIALEPRDNGLLGITLRYPYEVRDAKDYFDDIPDESVPKDMLELATHIVHSKAGHFKPDKFEDRFESALRDLIKRKQHGEKIEAPKEREPAKVIDLMEALRKSAKGAAPARRSSRRTSQSRAKKSTRSGARHRKAG